MSRHVLTYDRVYNRFRIHGWNNGYGLVESSGDTTCTGSLKSEIFTAEPDVYGYAMTCYEVITGRVLCDCYQPSASDYDVVLDGKRRTYWPYWLPRPVTNLISLLT
ncbi:hypothetical protein KC19_2G123200 [Ceratodon purpureus]|uniref:Uncharacterized protein n=1 Tax=Ceratodon purpureus TaxID=3225 RepID=A0A8T0IT21_CERPU|nr:hypothetical protein KC19_2G123200 [Ceratodon purpureus]